MEELKPCPFCGGRPMPIETHAGYGFVQCSSCGCAMGEDDSKTPEELTEDWNRRAELTCRDTSQDDGWFMCSKCGAFTSKRGVTDAVSHIPIRYCPNCGAKVVE